MTGSEPCKNVGHVGVRNSERERVLERQKAVWKVKKKTALRKSGGSQMLISLTAFAATGMELRFIDVESFLPSNAY